jgi:hypothetical protein
LKAGSFGVGQWFFHGRIRWQTKSYIASAQVLLFDQYRSAEPAEARLSGWRYN